jgi:hypothetical protein
MQKMNPITYAKRRSLELACLDAGRMDISGLLV